MATPSSIDRADLPEPDSAHSVAQPYQEQAGSPIRVNPFLLGACLGALALAAVADFKARDTEKDRIVRTLDVRVDMLAGVVLCGVACCFGGCLIAIVMSARAGRENLAVRLWGIARFIARLAFGACAGAVVSAILFGVGLMLLA